MSTKKITPDAVKKIENALEERKTRRDRRNPTGQQDVPVERRSGQDRRNTSE